MKKNNSINKVSNRPGLSKDDFYINEQGFMVFTAHYHENRGYCCKNGCLHCPYDFKKEASFTETTI